jgi:serine/threonine-protein kinase
VDATAIDRDRRPASARTLGDRIERFLDGDRDVSLRRRLAGDHLAAARAALAGGDTAEARATAMREAGRALALDPASTAAAEVVTGLLLAPPREVPPEVERELEAIDDDTTVTQNRLAVAAFLAYLAFVPYFAWMGASWPWLVAIAAMAVVSGVIAWIGMTTYPRRSTPLFVLSLVINAALIAVMARVCTPFLVAPGIAGATTMSYAINPREGRRTSLLVAAMLLAVFVPWLLEHAGVLSRTMAVGDGALILRSPALALDLTGVELGLAAFTLVIIVSVGLGVRSIARAQDAARRVQQVQAWHLRQLVTAR